MLALISLEQVLEDKAASAEDSSRARWQLGRIMRELVARYGIENE